MNVIDRGAVSDLADQLILEYRGALPPGQVIAEVFRTARQYSAVASMTPAARLASCEAAVRHTLTERVASRRSGSVSGRVA